MDVFWDAMGAASGVAAAALAFWVWRQDHAEKRERQARLISAWVVREGRTSATDDEPLRGVVVRNNSDAPVAHVGVQIERLLPGGDAVKGGAPVYGPDGPGQLYAQIPPGTYYLQRNADAGRPWAAPHAVAATDGDLRVTIDGEAVSLVPVTEVHATFRLTYLGFHDTADRPWWRVGMGGLTGDKPAAWSERDLLPTAERELPQATTRRGRSETTEQVGSLLRAMVNEVADPRHGVDTATFTRMDVDLRDSTHPLAQHLTSFGLAGGTGMGIRLCTGASRDEHVYYLEGNRDGLLPAKFFYGHLGRPDVVLTRLREELVSAGGGADRADAWTPAALATALAQVVATHQSTLATNP